MVIVSEATMNFPLSPLVLIIRLVVGMVLILFTSVIKTTSPENSRP